MSDSEFPPNSTPPPNKPVAACQFDRVHAAIWRNVYKDGNPAYFASFTRSFRTDDGEFRTTTSFTNRDLPHLILAVEWAIEQLQAFKATEPEEDNP